MRRKYGSRTSQRAYRIEHDRYSECQFRVRLSRVEGIIKTLSRLCNVEKPKLKFRSMRKTLGHYQTSKKLITNSSYESTIRFGTIVHEFAHHLNFIKDHTCGHDAQFFRALDRVYTVAKDRYAKLIEKNRDAALAYKETQRQSDSIQIDARRQFRIGQRVSFNTRRGERIQAVVKDILPKNIRVQELENFERHWSKDLRSWRVSPSLLKLVESA